MAEKRIHRLPSIVIDRIAAGEVIEGPSSVVKELVENAIDAGAKNVTLSTQTGGLDEIQVQDNGGGILFEDLADSIERHATSKIRSLEDIERILSFGFRGEALASIASVSLIEIQSCPAGEEVGGRIESRGGVPASPERIVCAPGTRVRVRDLFFATPARKKFIKSERTENQKILKEVRRLALAHPGVTLTWIRDGEEYVSFQAGDAFSRIREVTGAGEADQWMEISGEDAGIKLHGWITSPEIRRSNREAQYTFVNGRWFEMKYLSYLLKQAYGELMPHGFHPSAVIYLEIDPAAIDVNVHPAKKEVRFIHESRIHSLLIRAIQRRLSAAPVQYSDAALERNFTAVTAQTGEQGGLTFPVERSFESRPQESREETTSHVPPPPAFPIPESLRQLGVIFGTYILAEDGEDLYLIDQHTAHERVHYERNRARFAELSKRNQPLLHPVVLNLPAEEIAALQESGAVLEESGFEIDILGPKSAVVRSVPAFIDPGTETETLRFVLQRILDGETAIHIFDEYAAMKACKASIKRNDRIAPEILAEILKDLLRCGDPSRCPHGRPTMVRISRSSLDRMFLRS